MTEHRIQPQSASTVGADTKENVLIVGSAGSGKTTFIRHLKGKTFVFVFDPHGLRGLQGLPNVDYKKYDVDTLDIGVKSLTSEKKGGQKDIGTPDEPKAYREFELDLENSIRTGFFNQYNNIVLDSLSTFSECVMDRVQWLNKRMGQQPMQDDWAAQKNTVQLVMRTLLHIPQNVVVLAHELAYMNEMTKTFLYEINVTGRLRVMLPTLFSDILHAKQVVEQGRPRYKIDTVGSNNRKYVRCSHRGVPPSIDVTISNWNAPGEGLSKIFLPKGEK